MRLSMFPGYFLDDLLGLVDEKAIGSPRELDFCIVANDLFPLK